LTALLSLLSQEGTAMNPEPLVNRILDDEGLTRDLDGEAAALLVAWLVERVEGIAARNDQQETAMAEVEALCSEVRETVRQVPPDGDQVAALKRLFPIP
jgi:hypothetical protein